MSDDPHDLFAEQFAKAQFRVYGYILTLLPNRDDADDAFQETCVVLWKKWSEWDRQCKFVTWACGIAHHVVRNVRRSKRRATSVALPNDILDELAGLQVAMESQLSARREALTGCLEKLPPPQRELIERTYLSGTPIRDVAQGMTDSASSVYMRLYRIRQTLHDCIDRAVAAEDRK
jgi:RNA polymerase sigma-70 factor (ECF subfamily)